MKKEKNLTAEEKIIKYSKGLKITAKVLYILSMVATVAFIVLAIVMPLTHNFKTLTKEEAALLFAGLAVYAFFLINVLWNIEQIFRTIEAEKSPFGDKVTKYIVKTGIAIILVSVIPALLHSIFTKIFADGSQIQSTIQLSGVAAGIVLIFLGNFFKYGAELKKRDDETI